MIPRFDEAQIRKMLAERMQRIENAIVFVLSYLGEQCVNKARELNTYRDQTGNLRNSIGYVIAKNGRVIKSNFKRSAKVKGESGRYNKGSKDGTLSGRELARSLASQFTDGYALIVVAGMDYALKVESMGKDVLTSAEQFAEAELPGMLRQLQKDVAAIR